MMIFFESVCLKYFNKFQHVVKIDEVNGFNIDSLHLMLYNIPNTWNMMYFVEINLCNHILNISLLCETSRSQGAVTIEMLCVRAFVCMELEINQSVKNDFKSNLLSD